MRATSGVRLLRTISVVVAILCSAMATTARADWLKAESPHFIVYADTSESSLRNYVRKVERFDALLRTYYGVANDSEDVKLEIYLANRSADLRRIEPTISGGIAGFYSRSDERIYAVIDLSQRNGDSTLFHEYAHHFMLSHIPAAYPAWFIEGFAEYYATAKVTGSTLRVGDFDPGRVNSLTQGANTWLPMDALLGRSTGQLRGSEGHKYYAQAWALTHYFMSSEDLRRKLSRYLSMVMAGGDPVDALASTVGRTPAQLQDDLRRYLGGRITTYLPQITLPEAEVTITRLDVPNDELVWLDLRMDRAMAWHPGESATATASSADGSPTSGTAAEQEARRQRERALEQAVVRRNEGITLARSLAERYPNNRLAQLVGAKADLAARDWASVDRRLASLSASDSTDGVALLLSARARLEWSKEDEAPEGLKAQARALLARAVAATPTDYRIYLALDDSRQGVAGYPNDNDLNILLAAVEYAPQVPGIRYRAAQALIHAEVYQQAAELLAPVANDPHNAANARRMRALLDRAREGAGMAALQITDPTVDAPGIDEDEPGSGD